MAAPHTKKRDALLREVAHLNPVSHKLPEQFQTLALSKWGVRRHHVTRSFTLLQPTLRCQDLSRWSRAVAVVTHAAKHDLSSWSRAVAVVAAFQVAACRSAT